MVWIALVLAVACCVLIAQVIRARTRWVRATEYRTERTALALALVAGLTVEASAARAGAAILDPIVDESVVVLTGRHHVDDRLADLVADVRLRVDALDPRRTADDSDRRRAERRHGDALAALIRSLPALLD